MLKSETREIGGRKLEVTQLGTGQGLKLFFKLGKLVGPSIATLIRQWQGKAISKQVVADAMLELVEKLEWSDFQELVNVCAKSTSQVVTNERGETLRIELSKTIDTIAFAGDYLSLMKWLAFCLELNFASFFVDLGLTALPNLPDQA